MTRRDNHILILIVAQSSSSLSRYRMRAILAAHQTYPSHPFIYEPGILAGAQMVAVINSARKHVIIHRSASPIEPRQQTGTSIRQQLELNGPTCLLLHDDRTGSDLAATDQVADLHLNEVAAPQLTVDSKVEKRSVSHSAALIEVEPDFPNLLWLQGTLGANSPSRIPDRALDGGGFSFKNFHDHSPMAKVAIRRTFDSR